MRYTGAAPATPPPQVAAPVAAVLKGARARVPGTPLAPPGQAAGQVSTPRSPQP